MTDGKFDADADGGIGIRNTAPIADITYLQIEAIAVHRLNPIEAALFIERLHGNLVILSKHIKGLLPDGIKAIKEEAPANDDTG